MNFPISVRVILQTYYHSITRKTNCINLNKLITLKHGNNAELTKTWLLIKSQTRKYFFQELKYFVTFPYSSAIKPITVEVRQTFPKKTSI